MSIFFLFTFIILFIPFSLSRTVNNKMPGVICAYEGQAKNPKYIFSMDDIPERCDTFIYSSYLFDVGPDEADKSAIQSLVGAGYTVYVAAGFNGDSKWSDVFGDVNGVLLDPFREYIKNLSIAGIILDTLRIYGVDPAPPADYATQINAFVTKMKTDIPTLKVGMFLNGYDCNNFGDKSKFDFSITNEQLDVYIIDTTKSGIECNKDSAKTGRYPLTSSIASVVSWDNIGQGISVSNLDPFKVHTSLTIAATKVDLSAGVGNFQSYDDYCSDPHNDQNILWCGDSIKLMYDEVVAIQSTFKGIVLMYLDRDDMKQTCGCGKHPVADNYIDAWLTVDMKGCNKIA